MPSRYKARIAERIEQKAKNRAEERLVSMNNLEETVLHENSFEGAPL